MAYSSSFILLGGEKVIGKGFTGQKDLVRLARQGIGIGSMTSLITKTGFSEHEITGALPVSERTVQREKKKGTFNPLISERLIVLADLFSRGEEVFGSSEKFREWMHSSNHALGEVPMRLLDTSPGIEMIRDELVRIEHGVFS
jgi:putative toxin-antitoxin system antitoxin component (TIGR02293 family)